MLVLTVNMPGDTCLDVPILTGQKDSSRYGSRTGCRLAAKPAEPRLLILLLAREQDWLAKRESLEAFLRRPTKRRKEVRLWGLFAAQLRKGDAEPAVQA
jgi:hypothetical protein